MAGLNAAFERVAKAAERRLEAAARKQERQVERTIEGLAKKAGAQITAALAAAVKNIDKLAADLRISSGVEREQLRRALETANGAVSGFKSVASIAALAPHPLLKAVLLGVGTAAGAAEGAGLEGARREMDKLRSQAEAERIALQRTLAAFQREAHRAEATRRRTGKVG